jgi:hypothetical protein
VDVVGSFQLFLVDDSIGHRNLPVHYKMIMGNSYSVRWSLTKERINGAGSKVGISGGDEGYLSEEGVEVVEGVQGLSVGAGADGAGVELERGGHASGDGGSLLSLLDLVLQLLLLGTYAFEHHALQLLLPQ